MSALRWTATAWLFLMLGTSGSTSVAAPPVPPPVIEIWSPDTSQPVTGPNDQGLFQIEVTVASETVVSFVTARVGSVFQSLTSGICVDDGQPGCRVGWSLGGQIEDFGLALGPNALEIVAVDQHGQRTVARATVDYRPPPTVTVWEPFYNGVATPTIVVRAVCQDVVATPCSVFGVRVADGPTLLVVDGELDHEIDLAAYDGTAVTLEVVGIGAMGTPDIVKRVVHVEDEPRLEVVERAPNNLRAANGHLVVYMGPGGVLVQRDRATGLEVDLHQNPGFALPGGVTGYIDQIIDVVVAGAATLFSVRPSGSIINGSAYPSLHEYSSGTRKGRGEVSFIDDVDETGRFVVWRRGGSIRRLDILTGAVDDVTSQSAGVPASVGANGDVVFRSGYFDVDRYRDGQSEIVVSSEHLGDPRTDGIHVVYTQGSGSGTVRSLHLLNEHGPDERLAPPESQADFGAQLNAGFVAFARADEAGTKQVWRRHPNGESTKLTSFATDSQIEALGPNGEIVHASEGRRCFVGAGSEPVAVCDDIGSTAGEVFYIGDRLHWMLGSSLLRVDVPEPAAWALQSVALGVLGLLSRRRPRRNRWR